jgi:putative transposase
MSIPSRNGRIAGTCFVTSRTWENRALFAKEACCAIFIDALQHYRNEGAYALHAFVLMPDHFHILLTPANDKSLERVVQYIKDGSARRLAPELNMRFPSGSAVSLIIGSAIETISRRMSGILCRIL